MTYIESMMRHILILLTLLFLAPAVHAADEGPYVQIRLVPEHGHIKPGEEIWIAVEQSIASGWHTYWKNPGDSGASPIVKWTLPEGFAAGEIEWPVPHKLPYGPLLNYGYENSAILLQKLKAPASLPEGPITLKADIDVLVCQEICIPETGTYSLVLNGSENELEDNSAWISTAVTKLPKEETWSATYHEDGEHFVLQIPTAGIENAVFIPEDWGLIANPATPEISSDEKSLTIRQKRGERAFKEFADIRGLLTYEKDGAHKSSYFYAQKGNAAPVTAPATETPPRTTNLLQALILAVLGGLVLNLMPCVFPVLSIKALGLVRTAEKSPALAKLHGLAYTAGVLASFIAIAALLLALKAAGSQIGWGFQLQSPEIVTVLAWLLFIIGLNLSGVFDIGNHFGNVGQRLTQGGSPVHSFFTGVLATLVATPCTAPFMGVALGFALVQPAAISLLIFAALGFGLALPYLALSFLPALQHIMPKPGAWMETFRQLLAFPMYASSAWLVWVLSQQSGSMGVFAALMGVVLIGFGVWLLRHSPEGKTWRYIVRILAILSFLFAILMIPSTQSSQSTASTDMGQIWSQQKLDEVLSGDKPIFVEMTAAWCITCKLNHAVAINTNSTRRLFADHNVEYLVGDWTNQDPAITGYLASFGRSGVPLYVYYAPRKNGARPEAILLPQILTPGIVAQAIATN